MIIFFLLAMPAYAQDDFQVWSQVAVKMIDTKKFDLTTFADLRKGHDAEDVVLYFVSEKMAFDLWKYLSLGLNYTYLNSKVNNKVASRSEFKEQHRAEVEVNPHWGVGDWLKISVRNRVEFRWIEDNGSHNTRYRHRWTFTFPLKGMKALQAVYFNSELFYDQAKHEYNENRTVPLGLKFKINDKASFDLYYMIQSKGVSRNWSSNQVLGTLVSVSF